MTPTNRESGWSCVELMASMCILVVGLLSLACGFYGSSTLAEKARQNNTISLAYRNVVAGLEASDLASIESAYGSGSGKDQFWCGGNSADTSRDEKVFYTVPLKPVLTGTVQLLTKENQLPATWSGFGAGLDMNCDGALGTVTSLAGGVVGTVEGAVGSLLGSGGSGSGSSGEDGSGGGGSASPLKILPAQINLAMDGFDGQRTLDVYVILAK